MMRLFDGKAFVPKIDKGPAPTLPNTLVVVTAAGWIRLPLAQTSEIPDRPFYSHASPTKIPVKGEGKPTIQHA